MFINSLLSYVGMRLTKKSTYDTLCQQAHDYADKKQMVDILFKSDLLKRLSNSSSQEGLRQDIFVLTHLQLKEEGYFVEFGAANGRDLSNTYLLEKEFKWHGILAEPAKCWHKSLQDHRTCHIDTRCVWKNSNSNLPFLECEVGELSTINNFANQDVHGATRASGGKKYDVKTVSLIDLLDSYNAPPIVDYLSIDTEGSELEILEAFDFDRFQFRVITCENSTSKTQDDVYKLLTSKGYNRVHTELSKCDDWYVKNIW